MNNIKENKNVRPTPELMPTKVQRMTKQRTAIINMLVHSTAHPTAEEIHAAVKEELPDISIGTVYRNLQMLLAEGLVQEITQSKTGSRFDGNQKPHSHFFCQCCGKVYDVPQYVAPIASEYLAQIPGQLESQRTDFFGICEECLADEA